MVFSSLFFVYMFLPICLIMYFATKNINYRNIVLTVFSLIFYAWGEPAWVCLLVFSAAVDFLNGIVIDKYRNKFLAKVAVANSLIVNLGLLGIFKYSGFIVENINNAFSLSLNVPQVTLPIGISFYTFQTISYTIDCYWGKVPTQKSFGKFLLYVSMFPQLVAGPIVRYSVIGQEISQRTTTAKDLSDGLSRFTVGLAKKVIVANNLSVIVDAFFGRDIEKLSVVGTWYAVIIYAMQVYFDFSGYSDMAIGLGRIFGFHFDENFNYPFICGNITEFWQRWHISLGSFFRDYLLYLPIFGKRRKYLNLFLVWFSTGLWHGASWNYIIWGLYFGVFIFLEMLVGKKRMKKIPSVIMHIYNKIVIIIGFGIFYFEDMGRLGDFFKNLIGLNGNQFFDEAVKISFFNNIFLILAALIVCMPIVPKIKQLGDKSETSFVVMKSVQTVCNLALLLISSIMLVDATNNPFLYFRF
ncbi:MAG: MBOAT family O-acyltransferase [Oscillospiraceae bacterium]